MQLTYFGALYTPVPQALEISETNIKPGFSSRAFKIGVLKNLPAKVTVRNPTYSGIRYSA